MRKHYDSTFTKESRDSKKKKIKRDQLDYEKRIFDRMTDFLHSHNDIVEREKKEQLLENCYKWNLIRKEFYDNKNPFMGIRLIKYINYYPNIKRFLADWFWTYKEK